MKPTLSAETGIFDKSIIVNFDGVNEQNELTHTGGYMRVTKDEECQCYNIIIFDKDGNVFLETNAPFDFVAIEDIY